MSIALTALLCALVLLILPGAWLAFGFALQPISFPARLAIAGALSPFIVALQFYLVRFLGVSFEVTAWVLLIFNLGSVWLIARRWKDLRFSAGEFAVFAVVFFLLAACVLIPWATSDSYRLYHSHQWMQTGIVYQFSEGRLIPEEPELAGVHLRYPWLGHIYWAVLSKALDMAPTRTYVLTNVFSLLWICVLVYETCRARSARPFAGLTAILTMALGTGAVGYYLWILRGRLPGDIRYTPWLRKFTTFEHMPFAMAMFAAIVFLAVLSMQKRTGARLALMAILLGGVGLIYPVVFPGAAGFCGVFFLLLGKEAWSKADDRERKLAFGFLAALLVVALICLAHAHWLTEGRNNAVVVPSQPDRILDKTKGGLVALSPLLLGVALLGWKKLTEKENLLLLGGAIPGFLCYVFLRVSSDFIEYKFMFGLAVCLAPLASLALERWPSRVPVGVAVIASAALFFPAILAKGAPVSKPEFANFPKAEDRRFQLRLAANDPDRNWSDAVRESTPPDTILAIRRSGLYLPALTERSLLGPAEQTRLIPGYWVVSRYNLVELRGYSPQLVDDRENLVRRIFDCSQDCKPEAIDAELRNLRRPVAIVFYPGEGRELEAWLGQHQRGGYVHAAATGPKVWLYKP